MRNDYEKTGTKGKCPVCGGEIELVRTKEMILSPFYEGCYHPFYGVVCSCGFECYDEYGEAGSDAESQMAYILGLFKKKAE